MSRMRLSMKKLKEVYRLKFELQFSNRQAADSVKISPSTVSDYVSLFKATGHSWADVSSLNDYELEKLIFRHPESVVSLRPQPDWAAIRTQMQRKGVTLRLLWDEYKSEQPDGLGYSQFARLYRDYAKTLSPVMRFEHKAGEKTFVDYAGMTMQWIEKITGEVHTAQIFVGCLGGSSLIYAEATKSQQLLDWIESHIRMFEAFGGVSEILVPDNLKSGVIKAHLYDPDINQTYCDFAQHYNTAVFPTRAASPRDKAKAENAVLCVERRIIAACRNQTFYSLHEINEAIKIKLKSLNDKPMQRIELSRQEQFDNIEKETLKPLPQTRYELCDWKTVKVHPDYHVCINKHFYSVPHGLIGKKLEACISKSRVDLLFESVRVATHVRDDTTNRFTTIEEHMPPEHLHYRQEQKDASIERLIFWSEQMGFASKECVKKFFQTRALPQQAIRAVIGLKRLAGIYGKESFEKACEKTIKLNSYRYKIVADILKHELHQQKDRDNQTQTINNPAHFRGADYYK